MGQRVHAALATADSVPSVLQPHANTDVEFLQKGQSTGLV